MCVHFALDVIRGATNICSMVVECREKGVVVTERERGEALKGTKKFNAAAAGAAAAFLPPPSAELLEATP